MLSVTTLFHIYLAPLDKACVILIFSDNNIGEAGAQFVALGLVSMTMLARLLLGKNALGDDGGLKVAAAIKGRTSLTALDLM